MDKQQKNKTRQTIDNKVVASNESCFTGKMSYYYFIRLVSFLAKLFSLGILYPFITCWQLKWEAKHTFISGKQLEFDGNPFQILTKFIYWWFLSLITLGIFYFKKGQFALHKWKIKHTHFVGHDSKAKSKYKGSIRKFNKVKRRAIFIKSITIGLGSCWSHCYFEKWSAKKTIIDGYQLSFDGKSTEYLKKKIYWGFLSVITLGIYSFWLVIQSKEWCVEHTHCKKVEKENKKQLKQQLKDEKQQLLSEKAVSLGEDDSKKTALPNDNNVKQLSSENKTLSLASTNLIENISNTTLTTENNLTETNESFNKADLSADIDQDTSDKNEYEAGLNASDKNASATDQETDIQPDHDDTDLEITDENEKKQINKKSALIFSALVIILLVFIISSILI